MQCVYPHDKRNKRKSLIPVRGCPPIHVLVGRPIYVDDILDEFVLMTHECFDEKGRVQWNDESVPNGEERKRIYAKLTKRIETVLKKLEEETLETERKQ